MSVVCGSPKNGFAHYGHCRRPASKRKLLVSRGSEVDSFHDSAPIRKWLGSSIRVPFASFAVHKLVVRALSYSDNGMGDALALAQLNFALRVVGSANLGLAYVAALFIASAA
jgi:hypothetical protein